MLRNEAQWAGKVLGKLPMEDFSPVLNIGSSNVGFREKVQPWIESEIFSPLRQRGIKVLHHDLHEDAGIDIAGDLADPALWDRLRSMCIKTLVCCNVLEHVVEPEPLCKRMEGIIPPGGYILVTAPKRFPYHPDPIDTMFRPNVSELAELFPGCRMICGETIDCGTGWDYVGGSLRGLITKTLYRLRGMKGHGGIRGSGSFAPWLFRKFWQTCILVQKSGNIT